MTWSPFDLLRRYWWRATHPATAKRNAPVRRAQPWLELLEDRSVPSAVTISSSFNATAVPAGDTLWLSSVLNGVSGVGSSPVTVTVTNQTVSFTDSNAGTINVSLPNAVITLTPGGTSATTTFDTTNNQWVSNDPTGLSGNLFVSGYALALPSGLRGSDKPVTWTATFSTDTSGISFKWVWGAAAYNRFSTDYGSLGIKPCDNTTASSYRNTDRAGTPENYKYFVAGGGTGTGRTNYTGNPSRNASVSPDYNAVYGSISGLVYNDANNNGTADAGDGGIGGVALTLTGTSTTGQPITATTTTAADGTYSFTTDTNGNRLPAGTYGIAETQPAGYYQGSNNVGTDGGVTDGTLAPGNVIGSITLAAGDSAVNYNFGNIDPFTQVTPAYPYSSSNANTDIAFNESEVLAGASVNVAAGTFNIFYTDEHAMALGVSETAVKVLGTTVKNSTTVTITTGSTSGFAVGNTISGSGIPAGTTITGVGTSTITLSAAATANAARVALTVVTATYPVSPLSADPTSVTNPQVGLPSAADGSGRPIFPSLYVTDITADPNATGGDWQFGGTPIAPNALYGSWKPFSNVINETVSPSTTTATASADPTANGWNLGTGADPVPSGLNNAGYGTEVQWNLTTLYNQGVLIPGHNYRFYFIVHDGDQNRAGGDCGQVAYDFTYRGPATVSGKVYNDLTNSGSYVTGDPGIGGVSVTLTGTTAGGQPVSVSTITAADGTYSFTTDGTGHPLQGGTYTVTESTPAGYLPGGVTVGSVLTPPTLTPINFPQNFQYFLNNGTTGGSASGNSGGGVPTTGYVHDPVNSLSDNIFTGGLSKDTSGIGQWLWTNSSVQGKDDIADGFASIVRDPVSGDTVLVGGMDRYDASGDATVGFWFFQNAVSCNPNGTFSGVHSDGDLLLAVDFSGSGASSIQLYRWTGTDATGTLTPVTPPSGAMFLNVNSSASPVPWSFLDKSGNSTPQAGEFMNVGLDLTTLLGTSVPQFSTFMVETRSSTAPASTLSDLVLGLLGSVYVSSPPTGTVIPTSAVGSIVITDGQNGVNYDFGNIQPITVAGQVYTDSNGNGQLDSGETGLANVTLTLTGTSYLGQPVTATTQTGPDGSYTFTTDTNGRLLPPGTYQIDETTPAGYVATGAAVGTVNGTVNGTVVSATTLGSLTETAGQNGLNYDFGDTQPVRLGGTVYTDTNADGALDTGDTGLGGVTLTLTGTNGLGQPVSLTTTSDANGTYSFPATGPNVTLLPGSYTITETMPSGYLAGATSVGTVNGTSDGTVVASGTVGSIVLTSGQAGSDYDFGQYQPVTLAGEVYHDVNANGQLDSGEAAFPGVTVTLSGTNGLGQQVTATASTDANGMYRFTQDSNGQQLIPGTYQLTETVPGGYVAVAANVGTVNGKADGSEVSPTVLGSVVLQSGQGGSDYNFGLSVPASVSGTVYVDNNFDSVYDSGDTPYQFGATVVLSGTNAAGQAVNETATANANGFYIFADLTTGTYTLTLEPPGGTYSPETANVGTVDGTSIGVASSMFEIDQVQLVIGQSGVDYNFGGTFYSGLPT